MDSFEVENFRSLKHLKLEKLARVNLLVGKNNSGKTSVLEVLYTLTRAETADWFDSLENMRGIDNEEPNFRTLFYGFNISNDIQVRATYKGGGNGPKSYRLELGFMNEPLPRPRRNELKPLLIRFFIGAKKTGHLLAMVRGNKNEMKYFPISKKDEFIDLPSNIASRNFSDILPTGVDLDLLSGQISELILNKEDERLVSVMRGIDTRIIALSLDAKGRIYFNLGDSLSALLPINLMGEGIQRLLSVVAAIATTAGGIIIIDEIDNGLHYSALRVLWKGILQAALEYDVQVFASTHSAEALRHLTWVLDDEEYKSYREDVAAYTLIRAKDDTVRSYRYDYEQLDFAMEHDIEVRN